MEIFFARDAARTPRAGANSAGAWIVHGRIDPLSGTAPGVVPRSQMKIAFFSPLPPAKSGIADYSAVLLDHLKALRRSGGVLVAAGAVRCGSDFDALVYQLGNNPHHSFVYEMAMEHPGIIVLHEANLHHLIADLTIRRGDWDAYLREVEINGGAEAQSLRGTLRAHAGARAGLRHPDAQTGARSARAA